MTDAEKLRGLADYVLALGENSITLGMAFDLRRIADLLDAVPPETLRALQAGTWRAVPVEPTTGMMEAAYRAQGGVRDQIIAALAAAPKKPEE